MRGLQEPGGLVEAKGYVHVLDGSAGGTLSKVVEQRGYGRVVLVATNHDVQLVGAGKLHTSAVS